MARKRSTKLVIFIMMLVVCVILLYYFLFPYITPIKVRGIFVPYNYYLNQNHVEIYEYTGDAEEVIIPERIFLRKVTKLHFDENRTTTFWGNEIIKKVTIPNTVTSITSHTFDGCQSLEEVVLSANLKEIGDYAFRGCSSLKFIELPDGLQSISFMAFQECVELKEIKIPDSTKEISWYAFSGCDSLEDVTIPNTVEKISGDSFWGTPWFEGQLEEFVEVGNGVLIKYNGNSMNVKVPDGIRYIGGSVFYENETIKQLYIPKNVEEIGFQAIGSNVNLEVIVFENDDIVLDKKAIAIANSDRPIKVVAREESRGHEYVRQRGTALDLLWEELKE